MENELKTWHFGMDNDKLVKLVLSGKKTATTYLYDENDPLDDEESVLVFDNEKKACVTKMKKVIITEFKNINDDLTILEGEGSFYEWKKAHISFFKSINPDFNENTKVVFEIFEVTRNLINERQEIAEKIALANNNIFGKIKSIQEINAGFNNSIFSINDKYIIKICGDKNKENLFDIEANFYNSNKDNESIPTLYLYDKTKNVVPYVYEIIEKVNGKSAYYHWYKMNELQKEELIRKLMKSLKRIHKKKYLPTCNWSDLIKKKVLDKFNEAIDMFNDEERNIILESLKKYDEFLSDNRFSLIHNDLHFDNVLIDENQNIKLIDFNDSIIAPFDFDLRMLYMSVHLPWKWANIEMDPLQKPKDYKCLFDYVKKNYPEVNSINHLEKRMLIYWVLNEFKLLPKYREEDSKDRILMICKKILNQ